jgi:hypothetical protein
MGDTVLQVIPFSARGDIMSNEGKSPDISAFRRQFLETRGHPGGRGDGEQSADCARAAEAT